jgi:hypothetical protein
LYYYKQKRKTHKATPWYKPQTCKLIWYGTYGVGLILNMSIEIFQPMHSGLIMQKLTLNFKKMKTTNLLILLFLLFANLSLDAQIQENSSGNVGIGTSPQSGYKVSMSSATVSGDFKFHHASYVGIIVDNSA